MTRPAGRRRKPRRTRVRQSGRHNQVRTAQVVATPATGRIVRLTLPHPTDGAGAPTVREFAC